MVPKRYVYLIKRGLLNEFLIPVCVVVKYFISRMGMITIVLVIASKTSW